MLWIVLILGIFIGAFLGVSLMALLNCGSGNDRNE